MPSPEPLAQVDSAWLRMDDPTNLMVVTGVLVLDRPVPSDRARALLETRLLAFPRFRQRVVQSGAPASVPAWDDDPAFDLGHHFVVTDVGTGEEDGLERLASRLMSEPLDARHPLWQFHFVPHYEGGSALICRIHHCIGDGLALIYVMLSLADEGTPPGREKRDDRIESNPWDAVARAIQATVTAGLTVPGTVLRELTAMANNPARVGELASTLTAGVGTLGKLLLMESDPVTPLKGPLVVQKRVAWSRPIPVADVRRIGRVTGATINDVLVSAVAGGLRRYLSAGGTALDQGLDVRAVVPVNLRPIEEAHQLGNQFGLVFLSLPLGVDEPLDRLFEVRSRMGAIKRSPEAYLTYQLLRAIGAAPRQAFDFVVDVFQRKATAVMTNVIGPREPIRLAGVPLRQAMFWVPCAGRLGLGISVLSYAGNVWLGVASDA
ncbi:MAG: wax ester/triacylglycerol synthase family O-acyltransferase, partial [Vicinamibacterales bacterium]